MRTLILVLLLSAGLALAPTTPATAAPATAQPVAASWHSLVNELTFWWQGVLGAASIPGFGLEGADDGLANDTGAFVEPDRYSSTGDAGPTLEPDGSRTSGRTTEHPPCLIRSAGDNTGSFSCGSVFWSGARPGA